MSLLEDKLNEVGAWIPDGWEIQDIINIYDDNKIVIEWIMDNWSFNVYINFSEDLWNQYERYKMKRYKLIALNESINSYFDFESDDYNEVMQRVDNYMKHYINRLLKQLKIIKVGG